jgi:hypothetical protein
MTARGSVAGGGHYHSLITARVQILCLLLIFGRRAFSADSLRIHYSFFSSLFRANLSTLFKYSSGNGTVMEHTQKSVGGAVR